jgi:competence protein ComGF
MKDISVVLLITYLVVMSAIDSMRITQIKTAQSTFATKAELVNIKAAIGELKRNELYVNDVITQSKEGKNE